MNVHHSVCKLSVNCGCLLKHETKLINQQSVTKANCRIKRDTKKGYRGSSPDIINLCTKKMCCQVQALFALPQEHRYELYRTLGSPRSRSGYFGGEKKTLILPGIRPGYLSLTVRISDTTPYELSSTVE